MPPPPPPQPPPPIEADSTMATTEKILQVADQHCSLVSMIADREHAPFALESQQKYLRDLESKLAELKKEIAILRRITSKERKEHQDLRDSIARRYAHKIAGLSEKFVSKIEREEREFLEALSNQRAAEDTERYLEEAIAETKLQLESLTVYTNEYNELKEQSTRLYKEVFDGPSPEFPEEDDWEIAVQNAEAFYADSQSRFELDASALHKLSIAAKKATKAVTYCEAAVSGSGWDIFGGGVVADLMEKDNMTKAKASLAQVRILLAQAIDLQSEIGPFEEVIIGGNQTSGGAVFDGPSNSEGTSSPKLVDTVAQVLVLEKQIQKEFRLQKARAFEAKRTAEEAKHQLSDARSELEVVRKEVFESVTGGPCALPAPPPYEGLESPIRPPVLSTYAALVEGLEAAGL
ncbi:hypothetical protein DRE_04035 [Drechslerella stenobrocha 248]|uniref:Uncharacterized protein n=1 Tax=Drechslerella stenobrocha 248 TaxID=1043628 RepID=W7ICF8_9PEZI|nr:hypothetical protein DRE_04035 [Drechslerella stenobrocha 248]